MEKFFYCVDGHTMLLSWSGPKLFYSFLKEGAVLEKREDEKGIRPGGLPIHVSYYFRTSTSNEVLCDENGRLAYATFLPEMDRAFTFDEISLVGLKDVFHSFFHVPDGDTFLTPESLHVFPVGAYNTRAISFIAVNVIVPDHLPPEFLKKGGFRPIKDLVLACRPRDDHARSLISTMVLTRSPQGGTSL